MDQKQVITISEAIRQELQSIPYGIEFSSDSLYRRVLNRMREGGNFARPLQESVSRLFRVVRTDEVRLVKKGKSTWIKERV